MTNKQVKRTTGFPPKHWHGKGREGKPPTHGSGRTGTCEECGKPGAVTHDNGFRSIVMCHPWCAPDGYVRAHIEYIKLPAAATPATKPVEQVQTLAMPAPAPKQDKAVEPNDWQMEQLVRWATSHKA